MNTPFPGLDHSSVAWADFNNDGKLDLVLCGQTGSGLETSISAIWQNTGNAFSNANSLPAVTDGSLAPADFDNDGRIDLLVSGSFYVNGPAGTRIWRNTGSGFVDSGLLTTGVAGAVAWADFDNDGRLDAFGRSRLYRNAGSSFPVAASFTLLTAGSVAWADFGNDGRADLLLTGNTGSGRMTRVWQNTPTGFADLGAGLPDVDGSSAVWGDYNGDGRLDIFLMGNTGSNRIAQVWKNGSLASNTPPSGPSGLIAQVNGFSVRLQWSPAADQETPSASLTYNLRIGTTSDGGDIVSPQALASGLRLLPQIGNCQANLFATVTNLPVGKYYWSIQAIDGAFAGSSFGTESSFEIVPLAPFVKTTAPTGLTLSSAVLNATVNANGSQTEAYFEYGSGTNYGNTSGAFTVTGYSTTPVNTLISGLTIGAFYHYRIVASNSVATTIGADFAFVVPSFTNAGAGLPGLRSPSVAWGDYDGDGRLDVLLTGQTPSNRISQVWRNTGNGFTNIGAGLPGVDLGAAVWGDYDNDGRLDILLTGNSDLGPITQIWHNMGAGFSNINASLTQVGQGSAAWGDFDNDGRLDLVLNGFEGSNTGAPRRTQIWRNCCGNGVFTNINVVLPGIVGTTRWIDYDNDGLLDLLIVGSSSSSSNLIGLWRNTGNAFTNLNVGFQQPRYIQSAIGDYDYDGRLDISVPPAQFYRNTTDGFISMDVTAGLPSTALGAFSAWGDYNNDGRLDLLLTGDIGGAGTALRRTYLLTNTVSGFTNVISGLPGICCGFAAWGDYDNDGRLDILVAGLSGDGSSIPIAEVWRNGMAATNTRPTSPAGLNAVVTTSGVVLKWNAATDAETPSPGLSYNLRVGTTPGGIDVVSPESLLNGHRLVAEIGNRQLARVAFLRDLAPGTYYWSVQAIDTAFEGSPFASEQTLVVGPVILRFERRPMNQLYFQFRGQPGIGYLLQTSTDLQDWSEIKTLNTPPNGLFEDLETISTGDIARFYRLKEH